MNRTKKLALALLLAAATATTATAQIATPAIKNDLESRMRQVKMPEWFEIFGRQLSDEQRDALTVLYAYMPLTDMADNPGDYFLKNVDLSLRARRELPWGARVPDREFRHFVLPVRVNNERLDNHRELFYNELKGRIEQLSMADAILEVNHWCHEKATYEPSDGRTHSPEATVYTAIGRCGEESTFTVAALRAVGIPARQVYTPRWAHTDDNHAWVEAWADGEWYFLGACEPEPVLDLGWFNSSAARGMLMHTRVFGNYDGPEEVADRPSGYTEINVTAKYAPTDTLKVAVVDAAGRPVAGATVSYCIFNYCEFYQAVVKQADGEGRSSLSTGLGDLVVWATDGEAYGFEKVPVGKEKSVTVALTRSAAPLQLDWDIVPPAVAHAGVTVSAAMAAENNRRKAQEDSLRAAYTATFMSAGEAARLADELELDATRLAPLMADARGNHRVIADFLRRTPKSDRPKALLLIEALTPKDRSDITIENLIDHCSTPWSDSPLYQNYLLTPRVDIEELTPYRRYFATAIPADRAAEYRRDPAKWVQWVADSIDASLQWIPGNVRMSPRTVYEKRRTNRTSRNLFFVSAARAMGIPARIDPVTGKTQWADSRGRWVEALLEARKSEEQVADAGQQGRLILDFEQTGRIDDPKYYAQFTVSKIVDGRPQLLGYPEEATWSGTFAQGQMLDAGQYLVVSGQRLADGGVLSHIERVEVAPGETVRRPLVVRNDETQVQVIGSFDAETPYRNLADKSDRNIIATTGRGYYIVGLIKPGHEPSNHALRDLAPFKEEFERWGHKMLLLFDSEEEAARFDASALPALPATVIYGTDIDGRIRKALTGGLKLPDGETPLFVIADTFNRVVFVSQGYTIGLGEKLVDTIWRLAE